MSCHSRGDVRARVWSRQVGEDFCLRKKRKASFFTVKHSRRRFLDAGEKVPYDPS